MLIFLPHQKEKLKQEQKRGKRKIVEVLAIWLFYYYLNCGDGYIGVYLSPKSSACIKYAQSF